MIETLDPTTDRTTKDETELGIPHGWPEKLILIKVGEDKYACNHAHTDPPDSMRFNGLAAFETEASADAYQDSLAGLSGEKVTKPTLEVIEIARSKPVLQAVFYMIGSRIVDIFYVR